MADKQGSDRFSELKLRRQNGEISEEEFQAEHKKLIYQMSDDSIRRGAVQAQRRNGSDAFAGIAFIIVAVGLMLMALTMCSHNGVAQKDAPPSDAQYEVLAYDNVKARLRDPDSATFSEVRVSRKAGVPAVCGYVNSKNGFGGMSGNQRFISGGATALESDMEPEEFAKSWAQIC